MAENDVTIRVGTHDTSAASLDDLRGKLAAIGRMHEAATVDLSGKAALDADRLRVQLDTIGRKVTRPNLSIAGIARAELDLEAVKVKLDEMGRAGDGASGHLSRLGSAVAGVAAAAAKGAGLLAVGSAALAIVGPLGAAVAAAAAFAAVAAPAFKKPTPAVKELESSFAQLQKTMAPMVNQVIGVAAHLAKDLLPVLAPLATAGGRVIEAFLKPLDTLVRTIHFDVLIGSMSKFAVQVAQLAGPQLAKLLDLLLTLFVKLMPDGVQILKVLLPLIVQLAGDLVPVITVLADVTVKVLGWLTQTKLLKPVLLGLVPVILLLVGSSGIGAILIAISLLTAGIVELSRNWSKIWAAIKAVAVEAVTFIIARFRSLPGPLQDAIRVIGAVWRTGWDSVKGEARAVWDAISGLFRVFTDLLKGNWGKALSDLKATGSRVWGDIRSTLESVWRDLGNAFGRLLALLRSEAAGTWNAIRSAAAAAWNSIWNNTVSRVRAGVADVVSFIRSLPGKIGAAVGSAGAVLTGWGRGVLNGLLDGVKAVWNDVANFFKGIPRKILSFLGIKSPPQWAIDAGRHIMDGIGIGLSKAKGIVGTATAKIKSAVTGAGEGVTRWIPLIQQALKLEHLDPGLLRNVLYQMQTESGGNPRAINLTDANARRGDPSRGLMQVIGSTFQAYHWPGTSGDIYDPLANIAAALNYARHVYGPTLMRGGMGIGSGHGYAAGGPAAGWAVVGEHGRELVRLPTGSHVYSNPDTMSMLGPNPGGLALGVTLEVASGGQAPFEQFMSGWIKNYVRVKGGGNVQKAFGRN